jgi:hypothetical protein
LIALRNGLDQSESFLSNSRLVLRAVDLFASLGPEMQSSPMAEVTNSVCIYSATLVIVAMCRGADISHQIK